MFDIYCEVSRTVSLVTDCVAAKDNNGPRRKLDTNLFYNYSSYRIKNTNIKMNQNTGNNSFQSCHHIILSKFGFGHFRYVKGSSLAYILNS